MNNSYLFYNSREKGNRIGVQVTFRKDEVFGKVIEIIIFRVKKKEEPLQRGEHMFRKFWFGDLVTTEMYLKEKTFNTIFMLGISLLDNIDPDSFEILIRKK